MITDRKLGKTDNSLLVYVADVINFTDYSPYGTQLDNRHAIQANMDEYRYGFQDQEADDEIKGEGNSYNYEYRMNDPRLGRFFAVDPLAKGYPELTPYQFSSNSPIYMIELEGAEGKLYVTTKWYEGSTLKKSGIQVYTVDGLKCDIIKIVWQYPGSAVSTIDYYGRNEDGNRSTNSLKNVLLSDKPSVQRLNDFFASDPNNSFNTNLVKTAERREAIIKQGVDYFSGYNPWKWLSYDLEGGAEAGNNDSDYTGEKGFYEKGLPLLGATVGTVLTGGAGAGLFGTGAISTYVGSSMVGGTFSAGGNFIGQWGAAKWNIGEVDGLSVGLSYASGFIPGNWSVTKTFYTNVAISTVDAGIDWQLNGRFKAIWYNKSKYAFTSDLFFGSVSAATGGAVQKANAPTYFQYARNFTSGSTIQYFNTKVNDKITQ